MILSSVRRTVCAVVALAGLALAGAGPGGAQSPAPVAISVTGGPTPVNTLRLAIEAAARATLPEAREAEVDVLGVLPPLSPLNSGVTASAQATVGISSPSGPTQRRILPVVFTNQVQQWTDAQVLLVSNSPEKLPFGKVLYNGALTSGQTARLLYHHMNGSSTQRMTIEVTLSNPTALPLTLWVTGAAAGPAANELTIGHAAALRFLEQEALHAGFMMTVPPNTTMPLFVQDLPPLAIVSGLAQVAVVGGDRLNLQVVARLAGESEPPTASYQPNFDAIHQRGAFGQPSIVRQLKYSADGPLVTMTLGADGDLLHNNANVALQGNYGVVYTFNVDVSNPTDSPAVASLVMHADGGQAQGTFVVDGQLVEGPVVQPNAPQLVTAVHLAPGSTRTLQIITMPESGSNYPVRLLLGPPP